MKIALLGDIALIGRYDRLQNNEVEKRVQVVKQITEGCDFVIGNLESPLTSATNTHVCKGVYLRSDSANVSTLLQMGVTHVTLANNHIYDYGRRGAEETIKTLKTAGIRYVGLNNPPEVLSKGPNRVMLDGFCCLSANGVNYGNRRGQVKMLTPNNLESFFLKAYEKKCLPVASVHFGLEGLHYPSTEHMELFREFSARHNYILHGNHPHAIQGYEDVNHSLLLYALGNLCFDEATVTSIHFTPSEKPEERKNYIAIVDIENNKICSHKEYALTDLDTDMLHMDENIYNELIGYSDKLKSSIKEIAVERQLEISGQRAQAQKRNIRFYLNRFNYKYIGAYLNGRLHARQYKKMFKQYKEM